MKLPLRSNRMATLHEQQTKLLQAAPVYDTQAWRDAYDAWFEAWRKAKPATVDDDFQGPDAA